MIDTPKWAKPQIAVVYPPNNHIEFERWFGECYEGDVSDREYLGIYFCAYQVNHNYGNDEAAMRRLQDYVDTLPSDKKYFCLNQYDDGVGVDWKGKDVLEFNMSKVGVNKVPIPLIGEDHPYRFSDRWGKRYIANFIGNRTHPIRDAVFALAGVKGFYISDRPHDIETYCRIISESRFTLCPRGYGANSFRIKESLQYGSEPVYISDEFIEPFYTDFQLIGKKFTEGDLPLLDELLTDLARYIPEYHSAYIFNEMYSYNGCREKILQHLKTCS